MTRRANKTKSSPAETILNTQNTRHTIFLQCISLLLTRWFTKTVLPIWCGLSYYIRGHMLNSEVNLGEVRDGCINFNSLPESHRMLTTCLLIICLDIVKSLASEMNLYFHFKHKIPLISVKIYWRSYLRNRNLKYICTFGESKRDVVYFVIVASGVVWELYKHEIT